jgi:AhpD family alkylhydroperoxidase
MYVRFRPIKVVQRQNSPMSRIAIPTRDDAPAASQPILDAVYKQLGFVPNLHRLMSISPDVLTGFVGLQSSLAKTLDIKTRDAIALAVSEMNGCGYCIAAHSYVATNFARMSPEEITLNRQGGSHDAKRAAAATFAQHLMKAHGRRPDRHRLSGHSRPAGRLRANRECLRRHSADSAMPVTSP